MNQNTTTVPDAAAWSLSKNVLKTGELTGSVHLLGPDAHTLNTSTASERLVYVAQGTATAVVGPANYILNCDETLHVAADRSLVLRNHAAAPARVLVVTLPRKPPATSPLVFPR